VSPAYSILIALYALGCGGFLIWTPFWRSTPEQAARITSARIAELCALLVAAILWPLWAPFVVGSALVARFSAIKDKKLLVGLLRERSAIEQEYMRWNAEIARLSDTLAGADSGADPEQLLHDMEAALQARTAVGPEHDIYERIRAIYSRHREIYNRDSELGGEPPPPWIRRAVAARTQAVGSPEVRALEFTFLSFDGRGRRLCISASEIETELLDLVTPTPPAEKLATDDTPVALDDGVRFSLMEPEREEWEMLFSPSFKKSVQTLDKKLQGRILHAIVEVLDNPVTPRGDTVKPLTSGMKGMWRYRIGDYRLLYLPKPDIHKIVFIDVASRGRVYQ
jgi:mRNA interferase RelE/StbE